MSQKTDVLAATERPRRYINRPDMLQKIYDAIYTQDKLCHVVLIKGLGGLGKTRLLEEVMSRLGHSKMREIYPFVEQDWHKQNPPHAVSDLFDFIQINLHTRDYFLEELGSRKNWPDAAQIRFSGFEQASTALKLQLDAGIGFSSAKEGQLRVEKAFWQDYKVATRAQRLVIPLDTAEQLTYLSSKWLLENDLLEPEDLTENTQQWLITHILNGDFSNTTFLIAGRPNEGEYFFSKIEEAINSEMGQQHCHLTILQTMPLSVDEISQFYTALAEDENFNQMMKNQWIRQAFLSLATDYEQLEVLRIFTEGQPVRLSLYTDILIEGQASPAPLNLPYEQALQIAQNPEALVHAQKEIEQEFVKVLFGRRGDIRSQILQRLAQASRGLNAIQLHFVLYSQNNENAIDWEERVKYSETKQQELELVLQTLQSLAGLSIVKLKNRLEANPHKVRYGLQDEVYRIYADCMSESPSKEAEIEDRKILYTKIIRWLAPQRQRMMDRRINATQERLNQIQIEPFDRILNSQIPYPTRKKQEELASINTGLMELDLEYLHYKLLLNPYKHFYSTYFNLSNKGVAQNPLHKALFQTELTRTLNEEYAIQFIDWGGESDKEPFDTHIDTLQRKIAQNDVARWILFFAIQGRYQRAVELSAHIEDAVGAIQEENLRNSWQKAEVAGERACWTAYALALQDKYDLATSLLNKYLPDLNKLIQIGKPQEKIFGYKQTAQDRRLFLIIAEMYNIMGYIATQQGNFRNAVENYTNAGKSLRYIPHKYHTILATILNNHSRPLAEMGLKRGERIALDALEMRQKNVGDLIPIALSYNTLALINNLLHRPQEALDTATRAYAIAKHVGDERTLGLTLRQVGIGLRRLVRDNLVKYQFSAESEAILQQAEKALFRAREQFSSLANGSPSLRLVEVNIELGCLYRAWLPLAGKQDGSIFDHYYTESTSYLYDAINMARQLKLNRLLLDAQVNLAWTHMKKADWIEYEKTLQDIYHLIRDIAPTSFFEPRKKPPKPSEASDIEQYRPYYVFQQLSKVESLQGKVAMNQFVALSEEISRLVGQKTPFDRLKPLIVQRDKVLYNAAKAYAFATSYAEIFSPNAPHILNITYNDLYDYMRKFNPVEMHLYYKFDQEVRELYRLNEVEPVDAGDTRTFLVDSFGDYYDSLDDDYSITYQHDIESKQDENDWDEEF